MGDIKKRSDADRRTTKNDGLEQTRALKKKSD